MLVGVAQLDNCLSFYKNLQKAKFTINRFAKEGVDLVCFQEAFLSGYHAEFFSKDLSFKLICPRQFERICLSKNMVNH